MRINIPGIGTVELPINFDAMHTDRISGRCKSLNFPERAFEWTFKRKEQPGSMVYKLYLRCTKGSQFWHENWMIEAIKTNIGYRGTVHHWAFENPFTVVFERELHSPQTIHSLVAAIRGIRI